MKLCSVLTRTARLPSLLGETVSQSSKSCCVVQCALHSHRTLALLVHKMRATRRVRDDFFLKY